MTIESEQDGSGVLLNTSKIAVVTPGTGTRLVPVFSDVLADVEVELTVRLGSGSITVKELLSLKSGATITLDMPLNGVVDICFNEAIVGRGEIVAVGDHYGVRVTEMAELKL